MTNNNEAGTSRTIDAAGNIVPKPYGISRWANPRRYECKHPDVECDRAAVVLRGGNTRAHNCCAQHGKEWGLE